MKKAKYFVLTSSLIHYGNGITVDMTFYGGKQGGKFEDALSYCRSICRNS